jgi:hypothetical protein
MLMVAASGGNVANCEALLDGKASLDKTDRYSGWTALMHAASDGRLGPLELLVKRGASLTIKNKHGKTAIDVARNAGHTAAWVLLRQAVSASRQGGDAPEMNHKVGINMSVVVVPPIFHAKSIAHNIVLALVYSADAFLANVYPILLRLPVIFAHFWQKFAGRRPAVASADDISRIFKSAQKFSAENRLRERV